jgi:hypothetical protein
MSDSLNGTKISARLDVIGVKCINEGNVAEW